MYLFINSVRLFVYLFASQFHYQETKHFFVRENFLIVHEEFIILLTEKYNSEAQRLSLTQAYRRRSAVECPPGTASAVFATGQRGSVPLPGNQMSHRVLSRSAIVWQGGCQCPLMRIFVSISP